MLRSLEDMIDVAVAAADGEIGKIRNFLFDDQSWRIHYLVVDVRSWLTRHDVVISVEVIDQPDWEGKAIKIRLNKEQLRHGPDIDSKKPVSRQQELAMREYYGWPAYWQDRSNADFPVSSLPVGREFPVHSHEDPHLRSAEAVAGYEVCATDGALGHVQGFIVDEGSWHIGYLDVKTGDWLHRRSMLVPTRLVTSVSWSHHRVNVAHAWKLG